MFIEQLNGLAERFEKASDHWPNLKAILTTWPESDPEPDIDKLSGELAPMNAVPMGVSAPYVSGILDADGKDIGEKGALCFGGPYGCWQDTPACRYVPGAAGMIVVRRQLGQGNKDSRVIYDVEAEEACWDRFTALVQEAILILDKRPKLAPPNAMRWKGRTRWLLTLFEVQAGDRLTPRTVDRPRCIEDLWIRSAYACRYFAAQLNKTKQVLEYMQQRRQAKAGAAVVQQPLSTPTNSTKSDSEQIKPSGHQGMSAIDLARRLKVSEDTIRRRCGDVGIKSAGAGKRLTLDNRHILRLLIHWAAKKRPATPLRAHMEALARELGYPDGLATTIKAARRQK